MENCAAILEAMCKSYQQRNVKSPTKRRFLLRAIYGVKATTIFICSIIVSVFMGSFVPFVDIRILDHFLWLV